MLINDYRRIKYANGKNRYPVNVQTVGFEMKDYKFKSNLKLDSMIKSILANSRFSSFQEYVE